MRFLVIDDDARPTAVVAKDDVRKAREIASGRPHTVKNQTIAFDRVIRDPIHGDIRMTEFEWKLLATREMQRLRWIKQLGLTNLVYPGAEHSRLNHSIGAMHVADRILRAIEDRTGVRIDIERRLMARTYALVHDVTHIAYGHTLEDELNILPRHDENAARKSRMLLSEISELGKVLRTTDFGVAVLAHFDPSTTINRAAYLEELLSGPVGADVLDYIDRDAYFCGIDHRVDSAIYRRFTLSPVDRSAPDVPHLVARLYGGTGVRLDAEYAIESVLLNRFSLFMKVYTHPVKTSAGAMLGKALSSAMQKATSSKRAELSDVDLEELSDVELIARLRSSRKPVCKELAERIFSRQIFKPAFRASAVPPGSRTTNQYYDRLETFARRGLLTPDGRRVLEEQIARKAGVREQDVILYCSAKAPGLQRVKQRVEMRPGNTTMLDEVHTPHTRVVERHLALWKVYVFSAERDDARKRSKVGSASQEVLELTNELGSEMRQGLLFDP